VTMRYRYSVLEAAQYDALVSVNCGGNDAGSIMLVRATASTIRRYVNVRVNKTKIFKRIAAVLIRNIM